MLGKIIRITAFILFGLTVAFHILGGIGTSCVALGAENYDSMSDLVSYKWLYQLFVVITLAYSVYGIWAMVTLIRAKEKSYQNTLIFLAGILVISGAHMYASQVLRGKSAPTNIRVYFTVLTLIIFLILRIPGIWEQVNPNYQSGGGAGGAPGLAAIVAGILALTVQFWAAPSHIMNGGVNYADAWHASLTMIGCGLLVGGAGMILYNKRKNASAFHMRQGKLAPKAH